MANFRKILISEVITSMHAAIRSLEDRGGDNLDAEQSERIVRNITDNNSLYNELGRWNPGNLIRALLQGRDAESSPEIRREDNLSLTEMFGNANEIAAEALITCGCTHTPNAAMTIVKAVMKRAFNTAGIGCLTGIVYSLPEEQQTEA